MKTLTRSGQIKCGDHDLKAEITFTERICEKIIDGQQIPLKEPPEIIIKCVTCGREATTHHFTVDTRLIARIFQ
jgi:hypothetical protein